MHQRASHFAPLTNVLSRSAQRHLRQRVDHWLQAPAIHGQLGIEPSRERFVEQTDGRTKHFGQLTALMTDGQMRFDELVVVAARRERLAGQNVKHFVTAKYGFHGLVSNDRSIDNSSSGPRYSAILVNPQRTRLFAVDKLH